MDNVFFLYLRIFTYVLKCVCDFEYFSLSFKRFFFFEHKIAIFDNNNGYRNSAFCVALGGGGAVECLCAGDNARVNFYACIVSGRRP